MILEHRAFAPAHATCSKVLFGSASSSVQPESSERELLWGELMTHFLISDSKPDGYKLEDILTLIRNDILKRATKIMDDRRPEAQTVLENNLRILQILTESIQLAEASTKILDRSFGEHTVGHPRIGTL